MKINKIPSTFLGCEGKYSESKLVVFGAPFDCTTSFRPGTRFASKAMRGDSIGLETYSPYLDKDLSDYSVNDGGDLDLVFGSSEKTLKIIEKYTESLLKDNKIPVMIGGEHLVTLGAVRAAVKKYPDLHIVHFDAHTDLRDDYLGEKLSHATVMKRIWELTGDKRIHQFGIRSGERVEFEWAKTHTVLNKFNFSGLENSINFIKDKPVYLSIDLDVLDPSVLPGTGTPEAGGVSFQELTAAILKTASLNIVACDLNELSPVYDNSGASTALACKILRELLLSLSI